MLLAISMYVIQFFLNKYSFVHENNNQIGEFISQLKVKSIQELILQFDFKFHFFVLATVLIMAAGNIINDYFDVKADRINKPERLIIDKFIKRRWAMFFHWLFNTFGIFIILWISYYDKNWMIPVIAFISVNLLWFYSSILKRKLFIGNVIVAFLISIIPVYVFLYNVKISDFKNEITQFQQIGIYHLFKVILLVSSISFIANLLRELLKDIIDIKGDLKLYSKTFPIQFGIKKSKYLLAVFYVVLIFLIFAFYMYVSSIQTFLFIDFTYYRILILLAILTFLMSIYFIFKFNQNKKYKLASFLIKIGMFLGLLTPLFL